MINWRMLVLGCAIGSLAKGQSPPKTPNNLAPLTKPARLEGVMLDDRYLRPLKRGYVVVKPTGAGRTLSGETDEAG